MRCVGYDEAFQRANIAKFETFTQAPRKVKHPKLEEKAASKPGKRKRLEMGGEFGEAVEVIPRGGTRSRPFYCSS